MSDKELNLPDYITFAYNRFIMTRVEYLIFTQSEQEAKILRVIEWCIENERARLYREAKVKASPKQKVEIPDIVWVPISHSFFLSQLQGTVQSETTLKNSLSSLKEKHLIFREEGGPCPYDPPLYTINKHLLARLTQLLPPRLDDLDMMAIMKQERQVKKPREGQKLTPSIIDPLVLKIRESIIDPPDPQLLTLYQSKIDPLLSMRGGQKLTPKIYKENQKEKKESAPALSADADKPSLLSFSSEEEMIAYLRAKGATVSLPDDPTSAMSTENAPPPQDPSIEDRLRVTPNHPGPNAVTEVKHGETEKHTDSYSQNRRDKIPRGEDQEKILPFASIKPEMPAESMPWSAEKMVLLTECLRFCRGEQGVCFSTTPIGKSQKAQRDRQLVAARRILAEIPTLTQDEYVQAYSDQNNEWWNREKGSLTVEDMAANTPRKVMRTVELLEKVRTRSERIKERPPSEPGLAVVGQTRPSTIDPEHLQHLSKRALALADDWDRICGEKQPRSGNMATFEELAQIGATIEKMRKVRDSLLAEDFWHKRGVSPRDIIKHFHRASTQQTKLTGYKNSTEGHFVIDTQPYEPQSSYVPASRRKQLEKEKRQQQMKASLAQ